MTRYGSLFLGLLLLPMAQAQELTHASQVMGGPRSYRLHLPATYAASAKRYPVIYFLHGYESGNDERDSQLAAFAAHHDVILVDSGPVETSGSFPLYLPELAAHIDRTLRTLADRNHRAVSGFGTGGLLALWLGAKSPDLFGSASALSPARSAPIGPRGFEVDTLLDDLRVPYDAVRTRIFNSGALSAALDFHVAAFAAPLPEPKLLTHADPYPNFTFWGWGVVSNRRRPGMTLLDNVSRRGFHSVVREWIPGGAVVPGVKLTITSPALFQPNTSHTVTYLPLAGGKLRKLLQRTDSQGRLSFDLDGAETEVGIGSEPLLALSRYQFTSAPWATAGRPVDLRLTFWNKGAVRSPAALLSWDSPTAGVKFDHPTGRLTALAPGESVTVPLTVTAPASALAGAITLRAAGLAIEIPVYPPAEPAADFKILDESDHDGHASPGESFAISLPEGRAEIITADPCVDTSVRVVEDGARYTEAAIPSACVPGRIVHLLLRTPARYASVDFPIWYKLP